VGPERALGGVQDDESVVSKKQRASADGLALTSGTAMELSSSGQVASSSTNAVAPPHEISNPEQDTGDETVEVEITRFRIPKKVWENKDAVARVRAALFK